LVKAAEKQAIDGDQASALVRGTMTTKITVERVSADEVRVTLVADIRITGNLIRAVAGGNAQDAADAAHSRAAGGARPDELLTVEQAAEVLHGRPDPAGPGR
jgi:hypothetical protein